MGETIEFPSNGSHAHGYLAVPAGGSEGTIGVLVIQEWWGLVDQITRTCDRFAEAGFTALATDLYHGTAVPLTEPDEAAKQMMAIEMGEAARQLSGSVDELRRRTGASKVGVVGFCMGGGLALVLATQRPDAVAAVVPAYGVIPWPDARPDYSKLQAVVEGHVAELDGSFSPRPPMRWWPNSPPSARPRRSSTTPVSTTRSSMRTAPRSMTPLPPHCCGTARWPSCGPNSAERPSCPTRVSSRTT